MKIALADVSLDLRIGLTGMGDVVMLKMKSGSPVAALSIAW
jgi:hypothetical protein